MQVRFGALATPQQSDTAKTLAARLYGQETAANSFPELTFHKTVSGLGDFKATIDEVSTDGDTLHKNIRDLHRQGSLPGRGNVDVLYHWQFPSSLLARVGEATVRFFIARSKGGGENTVKRDGDQLLLRTRIAAAEVEEKLGQQ